LTVPVARGRVEAIAVQLQTPGAERLEVLSLEVRGPHPTFDEATFCGVMEPLLP
jgi:hypothetical protein